ncbi:hypothetical protein [Flavisolibacter tropicus]|uniref:Uncharacterized protein n=1 Tax=Flavisolibacter tropicus TaxID=1492898 RepID=A0A172TVD6_9BACT|nr:hypothetical protein [Flavisolibacter tropicus]ANE50844.1 hypothetical protein SY85_10325 [Flavisolibacter tropicus]
MKKQNIGLIILIGLVGAVFVYFFSSGKENSFNGVLVGTVVLISRAVYGLARKRQKRQAE